MLDIIKRITSNQHGRTLIHCQLGSYLLEPKDIDLLPVNP
jgi:hypothetical protein